MFVDDKPLSTFRPTQGWNMYQSSNTDALLKRPPAESPFSASSKATRPPLSSKTSSSSSLSGLEKNIPPFQTFILRTPPTNHDRNKALPPVPPQPLLSAGDSSEASLRRSSSVYSQTPSDWAPESVASWQTEDLQECLRVPDRPIAYSISVPDLKAQDDVPTPLEPREFAPLFTSPTMSTITIDNPPVVSRLDSTLQSPAEISPSRKPIETVSLDQAKESLRAPGIEILLPEELLAISKAKSQRHARTTSTNTFGGYAMAAVMTGSDTPTMVDREGRVRSITTPPPSASRHSDYPFPSVDGRLPSVNAFHVGTGPAREMLPPVSTPSAQFIDLTGTGLPGQHMSGQPKSHEPSDHFQLGGQPNTTAEEYHTLLAETYRQPSPALSGYDSDDSIRRHMKMIPQPLFHGKAHDISSPTFRNESLGLSRRWSEESLASSARGSNSFDLRLSLTPTGSRRTSRGSGSGYGDIPISPPSRHSLDGARKMSIGRGRSIRVTDHVADRGKRQDCRDHPSLKQARLRMTESALGANLTASPHTASTASRGPVQLLTKSVIELKLKTPLSSTRTSPLEVKSSTAHIRTPSGDVADATTSKKPFFPRRVIGSLRSKTTGKKKSCSTDNRSVSPTSSHTRKIGEISSPIPLSSTTCIPPQPQPEDPKRPSLPHLGWSYAAKLHFDETVSPPGTPTSPPPGTISNRSSNSRPKPKFTLLSLPVPLPRQKKRGPASSSSSTGTRHSSATAGLESSPIEAGRFLFPMPSPPSPHSPPSPPSPSTQEPAATAPATEENKSHLQLVGSVFVKSTPNNIHTNTNTASHHIDRARNSGPEKPHSDDQKSTSGAKIRNRDKHATREEKKAAKRREELKKMIRVVPNGQ